MIATMKPNHCHPNAHARPKHQQLPKRNAASTKEQHGKLSRGYALSGRSRSQTTTINDLPNEILSKIFGECSDISSILNLASTSKHLKNVWASCKKVEVLQRAAAIQYAPFEEAVQLVTFNKSEPAHIRRDPALSLALIKQIVKVGNTANKWLNNYPQLRWDDANAADRRLLNNKEEHRFRRALYRFWLYGAAFHDPEHSHYFHGIRSSTMDVRLMYVRRLTTKEIIECAEVHELIHDFVRSEVCPSNSKIQTHYNVLNPGNEPIYFGSYSSYPDYSRSNLSVAPRRARDLATNLARESWGSEATATGKAADVMKLNPAELLWVQENLPRRAERTEYFDTLDAFHRRPATFRVALEAVMYERGEGSLGEIVDYEGWAGILDTASNCFDDEVRLKDE